MTEIMAEKIIHGLQERLKEVNDIIDTCSDGTIPYQQAILLKIRQSPILFNYLCTRFQINDHLYFIERILIRPISPIGHISNPPPSTKEESFMNFAL